MRARNLGVWGNYLVSLGWWSFEFPDPELRSSDFRPDFPRGMILLFFITVRSKLAPGGSLSWFGSLGVFLFRGPLVGGVC